MTKTSKNKVAGRIKPSVEEYHGYGTYDSAGRWHKYAKINANLYLVEDILEKQYD